MNQRGTKTAHQELFVRNMRMLWRHDAELALRIDEVSDEERYSVEATRSGHWTARVELSHGGSAYLHSRHDPLTEARQWASAEDLEDKFCLVVSGLGLGYHIRELFERLRGEAFILCIEPCIRLFATALCCTELSDAIASGRLVFLFDEDKARLHAQLQRRGTLLMLGTHFLRHAPSVRLAEAAHAAIQRAVVEFISYTRTSLVTLMHNSRITCRNIAMNLVHYVSTPPIDRLRDRFVGWPGVVVAAGPSLSGKINQLRHLSGRAVLCAVQTALRPLLAAGVVPDFATSLDFHEMSKKFFDEVGDLSRTHLVAEPKATWHVLDHYPGPISVLDNSWARLILGDQLAARDGLSAGATVAHLAFYLAVYLGCDPIILVGQDLAFTGHVFYVPGVEIHDAWRGEINRFNTIEDKEWERIARNRTILRQVPGVDGTSLPTDELLLTYLEQFEKDIASTPRQVINATDGGARIRGAIHMTLSQAAGRYCERRIPQDVFDYRNTVRQQDNGSRERAAAELQRRIEEIEGVHEVCNELLNLLSELECLTEDPAAFNRKLVRVDELRAKVHQESRAYQIINSATQAIEFRRFAADRRIQAGHAVGAERARRQIARDREFIDGVRAGALDVRPMLLDALQRMREGPPAISRQEVGS